MANKKISELSSRTPSLSDLMLVGDPSSGYSYKCTITSLATIIETDIADGYVTIGTTQTISGAKTFSNVLTLTSVANSAVDTDKFLVLTASNTVNYRTGSEVLSDIGAASASSISGTTNYIAKFTSSSAIGNSLIFDNGTNVGVGTTSPSYKLDVSGTLRSTNSSYFATGGGNIGIGTTGVTGIGGPILQIHASTYPEIHLTNTTTGEQYQDGTSIHVSGTDLNVWNYESGSINFRTSNSQRVSIASDGNVTLSTIANATTDTDKFLVSDNGVIKYRTGAEVLSDIGGQAALTNPVTGTGTTNYIPKFTGTSSIGNSIIYETSGLIGIGTTTPSEFVHIKSSSYGTPLYVEYSGGTSTYIGLANTGGRAYLLSNNNDLAFATSSSATERMRLTSAGNLGIGTSSPSSILDVVKSQSAETIARIYNSSTNASAASLFRAENSTSRVDFAIRSTGASSYGALDANSGFIWYNGSSSLVIGATDAAGVIKFNSGGISERMRLDASGNLIVGGTSSSGERLGVVGSVKISSGNLSIVYNSASVDAFDITNVRSGGRRWFFGDGSGTSAGNFGFYDATASSLRMVIDASGNLGLSVTPSAWSASYKAIQISSFAAIAQGGNDTYIGNNWYNDGSNKYLQPSGASLYGQSNGSHFWFNAPSGTAGNAISFTQAMTLDASGNLGIGTTSPTEKLSLYGSTATTFGLSLETAGWNGAKHRFVVPTSGDASILSYNYNGSTVDYASYGSSAITLTQGTLTFGTGGAGAVPTERMRITSGGNVGIGTSSPTVKLQVDNNSHNYFQLNSTVANVQTSISAQNTASGNRATLSWEDGTRGAYGDLYSSTYLTFTTQSSEKMRITSGGELLINTTSDVGDYKLQVNGNIYSTGNFTIYKTTPGIILDGLGSGNSGAYLNFQGWAGTNKNWQIGVANLGPAGLTFTPSTTAGGTTFSSSVITFSDAGGADFSSNITTGGSIKTAAPSGYTAKPWKLGEVASTSVTLDTTRYVAVDIDGVVYYLALVTLN